MMTAEMSKVKIASDDLEKFGGFFMGMNNYLDAAEGKCKERVYSSALFFLNCASKELAKIDQNIGCVTGSKRRQTYDVLGELAGDEFASRARRILNIYCNGRQIR
ncbi:MAG: hypothetical protein AABW79_05005 [Nanoarchaeota archaeon]